MANSFECFSCRKVAPLLHGDKDDECPVCGSSNGQIVDSNRVREGMKAGVYYDIDPRSGGRAKQSKRKR